jgi:hypothetical protein
VSQLLAGWPNGTVGMTLGAIAGLLMMYQGWRDAPWDIHDEYSYEEPSRFSLRVALPSLVLLSVLITFLLGLGVVDKDVRPEFGLAGDLLGLLLVPVTIWYVFRGARHPRPS